MSDTKEEDNSKFIEVAVDTLNIGPRTEFENKYPELAKNSDKAVLKKAQDDLVNFYIKMDQFQRYQIFYFKNLDYEDLKTKFADISYDGNFLLNPRLSNVYSFLEDKTNIFHVNFCSYKRKEERGDNGEQIFKNVLFFYRARFEKYEDLVICTMQFPSLKTHPYQLYSYDIEVQQFEDWLYDKLNIDLIGVDLKPFFENIKSDKDFDRTGFEISDLKRENSEDLSADFKVKLPKMSVDSSKELFSAMDMIIAPDFADSLLFSYFNKLDQEGTNYDPKIKETFKEVVSRHPVSRRFFNLLHEGCLYGMGHLRYKREDGTNIRCTLEYLENRRKIIRLSHIGWHSFEQVFKEIRKFIKKTSA